MLFFSPCKEHGHSQREINYAKKPPKNPFPVGFHNAPLLPSPSPDQPGRAGTVGQPAPTQPCSRPSLIGVTRSSICKVLQRCKFVTGSEGILQERKKKQNSAERSLSSKSLSDNTFFPWKKSYLHGEFTFINDCGRIFLRKPLVNILAARECFSQLQMSLHLPLSHWFQQSVLPR